LGDGQRIVIVGAGGFGREVLDVLRAMDPDQSQFEFVGFVAEDKPDPEVLARIDASWLGTPSAFLPAAMASHYVIGIAAPRIRERISMLFDAAGLEAATLIHPTATFGRDVVLGAGSVMAAGSSVTTNIRVGRHVHLNLHVTVGHDCIIGDFVTIHPGVALSGGVTIDSGTLLGTTSCVLPGRSIGSDVVVGAGALVTHDVADGTTVVGIPARPLSR
jgi:sugar O-acyltransferase (sialic acid O-acetyltransferase NeuD family)